MGLTPCKPSHNNTTLHQTRDNPPLYVQVIDPEYLSFDERSDVINMIKSNLVHAGRDEGDRTGDSQGGRLVRDTMDIDFVSRQIGYKFRAADSSFFI